MKCPHCVQLIHRAAEVCPHCGYSLLQSDLKFGPIPELTHTLQDAAGVIRNQDYNRIKKQMLHFTDLFPQLFIAVYTTTLTQPSEIREFGFWLLNRVRFANVTFSNESAILITLDPQSKRATLTYGYHTDSLLTELDTFHCLTKGHSFWLEGNYSDGIIHTIRAIQSTLAKRCKTSCRNPKKILHTIHSANFALPSQDPIDDSTPPSA